MIETVTPSSAWPDFRNKPIVAIFLPAVLVVFSTNREFLAVADG
jgi:hypothetical protein